MKKRKNNTIFWVSLHTFRWAQVRWQGRDIRINTYIENNTLLVTKPGNRHRYVKICPIIAQNEMNKWKEQFEMPMALRKAMKK